MRRPGVVQKGEGTHPQWIGRRHPQAPSTRTKSRVFRGLAANGGTLADRWRRCTNSTRSGFPISAIVPPIISAATPNGSTALRAFASSISAAAEAVYADRWRGLFVLL